MDYRFKQNLIKDLPEIEQVNSDSGRFYITPEGNEYSSVTTILNRMDENKGGLDDWRKRVGEEEANKVMKKASARGNLIHSLCENYVLNLPVDTRRLMPIHSAVFGQIKRVLDKNLTEVNASEIGLYSDKLKVAGSCDLIGKWNGVQAIIDFKTSKSFKEEAWILNYYLQCAIYCYMLWERTGIMAKKLVVIIGCDATNEAIVYERDPRDFLKQAAKICFDHERKYNAN